jgi:hypothetical protein
VKFCQFRLKLPRGSDWAIRGAFDEAHCCGKPATCFITAANGFDYPLCAEHFDKVDKVIVQDKFAGLEDSCIDYFPCGSMDQP